MGTIFYSKTASGTVYEILFVSKLKDIHSRIRMSTIVDAPMFWVNLPYGLTHSVFNSLHMHDYAS